MNFDTFLHILQPVSDDFITLSYITGGFRGIECVGQAVAYGIKSHNTTDWLSIGLNIGFREYLNSLENMDKDVHVHIYHALSCLIVTVCLACNPEDWRGSI